MVRLRWFAVILALVLLCGSVAQADNPPRESPQARIQGKASAWFDTRPPLSPAIERLYINQTMCAIERLGLKRGCNYDFFVDWMMGIEHTFRPWEVDPDVWRGDCRTPGQRHAEFWAGYCVAGNCEVCEGSGCDALRDELATKFDVELSAITAR